MGALSVRRIRGRLLRLLGGLLGLYLVFYLAVHPGSAQIENTDATRRLVIGRLRKALASNMNEFLGAGTGDTFVPEGKIEQITEMTKVEYNDHALSSKPFIVSNPLWNCTKSKWSLEFIEKVAGDDVVGVETSRTNRFYSNEGLQKVRMSVKEFLRTFRDPKRKLDFYLAEENVKQFPGLEADISEPVFSEDHNLDKVQVWIGAGGQVSPLHHDQWDNVLCQLQGKRTLLLFDPLQSDRLYPKTGINRHFAQVDPQNPDFVKFPNFAKVRSYNVSLSAGEILFIPAHWWHQVHHSSQVNVAVNFWYMPNLMSELIMDVILPEGDNYV